MLSEKYKNLSKKENNLIQIKNILKELKQNNIYDYQNIKNYNKLFTCLNEKKEAIDFLFSKKEQDIDNLENRIEPTNRTIKIKDIKDTKVCVSHINRMKTMSEKDRFDYIKNMEPQVISQFINYSKKYLAIIELDLYYDNSENIYELVKSKIKDVLILNIYQDKEDFLYYEEDKCKTITLEELIYLKNKIPPLQPKTDNDETQIFKKAKEELEKIGELLKKDNGINTFADDENYKDIIRVIKEKLSNNEEKAKEFISCFIEFYGIVNEELVKDLTILFKSKKYELDINSMIFFF